MITRIGRRLLSTVTAPPANVPMELIKALRARTNAPIVDCKAALLVSALDIEAAQRYLRTAGLASINKKADRETTQGVIALARNDHGAVLVELQSETDFVAKNDRFLNLAARLSNLALEECRSSQNWENPDLDSLRDRAREDFNDALLAIRENIVLKSARGLFLEPGQQLASYIHNRSPNRSEIGQIGVLLRYVGCENEKADQIAMHIAAASPQYLRPEDVPAHVVEAERSIIAAQAEQLGKPANVTKGIVEGKLKKWKSGIALLEQTFAIGDAATKISDMLGDMKIDGFVRMRVGESS